ncbi:MAG: ABC-F family ATP-binding cassette domain-containing protein [Candidatus Paceibacterota bacterium]
MSMIQAKNIHKNYGSLTLLADVSFLVEEGDKVALVGDNGSGKTTLLKIIAGLEELDGGEIKLAKDLRLGYLPQDTSLTGEETVGEHLRALLGIDKIEKELENLSPDLHQPDQAQKYNQLHEEYLRLDGYTFTFRLKAIISGFGLTEDDIDKPLTALSSGQKSKVALAGVLLRGVDLLLLDEPTNNLDLPALIWLEEFIRQISATCIVVSHDRQFLDRTTKKIFRLDSRQQTLIVSGGTYSDYLARLAKENARQETEYTLQQKEVKRLTETARKKRQSSEKGSHWQGSDGDKLLKGFKRERAGQSARAAKVIEKRIGQMEKIEKPFESDDFAIPLEAKTGPGRRHLSLSDVVAGYPDGFRVGPLSLDISYGNRLGIIGLNGSGKSTLLKTITGKLPPLAGEVKLGSGVKVGNLMQEHETLPRDLSLLECVMKQAKLGRQESYAKLAKFGFDKSRVKQLVGTLSPGERARLLLAIFSARSVNTLILDEPTNHLDLAALFALEKTLSTYTGTVILVSHDRYFLERAKLDSTYILAEGSLTRVADYSAFTNKPKNVPKNNA